MPWGDYGRVLLDGMSSHLPRLDGRIQLERSGPFVPPVTFPTRKDVLVANSVRAVLEDAGWSPSLFRPVDKARIVPIHWETWDLLAPNPQYVPQSRSPEDYILEPPHDQQASDAMGLLWELDPPVVGIGTFERLKTRPVSYRVRLVIPSSVPPIFRANGTQIVFARDDAATLLAKAAQCDYPFTAAPVEVTVADS